jgi:hypothetical protein
VPLHCPGICRRQNERYACIACRTDRAEHVWFRSLIDICKGDELLNYLHQARNHSDHGIGLGALRHA